VNELVPTTKLRWVERAGVQVLQQYWAEDLPGYMRAEAKGEWRDIPIGIEAP
jgi:hypothetical protein